MSIWGRRAGLFVVFVWFMGGGITHFTNTAFFVHITPPFVPWPLAVVYVSGVLEILGAAAILVPRLRQVAGNCLILLTLAVTPANVYMWMHPELFTNTSPNALSVRLLVQVMLLVCIWMSTRTPARLPPPSGAHVDATDTV